MSAPGEIKLIPVPIDVAKGFDERIHGLVGILRCVRRSLDSTTDEGEAETPSNTWRGSLSESGRTWMCARGRTSSQREEGSRH